MTVFQYASERCSRAHVLLVRLSQDRLTQMVDSRGSVSGYRTGSAHQR
jgi:hypothetical protein